jgi:penicillin-binding protein 1A
MAPSDPSQPGSDPNNSPDQNETFHLRIRRQAGGAWRRLLAPGLTRFRAWFSARWQSGRLFRIGALAVGLLVAFWLLLYVTVLRTLPSADTLLTYQPPLPTMVRGNDGGIVYSYARERRVQLRYVDFPKQLVNAFLSAEDKNFFSHGGVDFIGLGQAVVDYALKYGG